MLFLFISQGRLTIGLGGCRPLLGASHPIGHRLVRTSFQPPCLSLQPPWIPSHPPWIRPHPKLQISRTTYGSKYSLSFPHHGSGYSNASLPDFEHLLRDHSFKDPLGKARSNFTEHRGLAREKFRLYGASPHSDCSCPIPGKSYGTLSCNLPRTPKVSVSTHSQTRWNYIRRRHVLRPLSS